MLLDFLFDTRNLPKRGESEQAELTFGRIETHLVIEVDIKLDLDRAIIVVSDSINEGVVQRVPCARSSYLFACECLTKVIRTCVAME